MFGQHGLPMSLSTDRGAHYFFTPAAGGEVDRKSLTQVGRAPRVTAQGSGPSHGAYSPQARGRSERALATRQDRRVNELKLAGVIATEAANAFIHDVCPPAHNARFATAPQNAARLRQRGASIAPKNALRATRRQAL